MNIIDSHISDLCAFVDLALGPDNIALLLAPTATSTPAKLSLIRRLLKKHDHLAPYAAILAPIWLNHRPAKYTNSRR